MPPRETFAIDAYRCAYRRFSLCRDLMICLTLLLALAGIAPAGTTLLTEDDFDEAACLDARAPRLSWAGVQFAQGVFNATEQIELKAGKALLLRFDLARIPADHRILKAELTVNPDYVEGASKLVAHRVLADWGPGVCYQYARTLPKKIEWAKAGCRGPGTDRALRDGAVFAFSRKYRGEQTAEVTERASNSGTPAPCPTAAGSSRSTRTRASRN